MMMMMVVGFSSEVAGEVEAVVSEDEVVVEEGDSLLTREEELLLKRNLQLAEMFFVNQMKRRQRKRT